MIPDPRLDEIQARLDAATPGPWETMRSGLLGTRVVRVDGEWDGLIPDEFVTLVTPALRIYCDADLIANAPADLAFLLAELRKAHEALERVEALADELATQSEGRGLDYSDDDFDRGWHGANRAVVDQLRAAVAAAKGDGE